MDELKGPMILKLEPLERDKYQSELIITANFRIYQERKMPCWFHRKMQKLFFGFEWRSLEPPEKEDLT